MANPSIFSIPGLFRLNLVLLELPTGDFVIDDRGNRQNQIKKIWMYLQLDPARSTKGAATGDGATTETAVNYEGSIVPCDVELDGFEPWTSDRLPPELLPGTEVTARVNGMEGTLAFKPIVQTCFEPAYQAGFGDRVYVTFRAIARSGNGL